MLFFGPDLFLPSLPFPSSAQMVELSVLSLPIVVLWNLPFRSLWIRVACFRKPLYNTLVGYIVFGWWSREWFLQGFFFPFLNKINTILSNLSSTVSHAIWWAMCHYDCSICLRHPETLFSMYHCFVNWNGSVMRKRMRQVFATWGGGCYSCPVFLPILWSILLVLPVPCSTNGVCITQMFPSCDGMVIFQRVSLNRCSHVYSPPFSADTFFFSFYKQQIALPPSFWSGERTKINSNDVVFLFRLFCNETHDSRHLSAFSFTHGSLVTSPPDSILIVFLHPLDHLFATQCASLVVRSWFHWKLHWLLPFSNTTNSSVHRLEFDGKGSTRFFTAISPLCSMEISHKIWAQGPQGA